jgi:hypothetical protein
MVYKPARRECIQIVEGMGIPYMVTHFFRCLLEEAPNTILEGGI